MRTPTMKSRADRGADRVAAPRRTKRMPVVEAAAVVVVALVGRGRPELVGQMAVGVDLEPIEPAAFMRCGGVGVVGDDARDVPVLHRLGERAMRGLAHRRGRDHRQPVRLVPRRPPAEMGDLDHHGGAMRVAVVGQVGAARARSRPCRRAGCRTPGGLSGETTAEPPSSSARCRPWPFRRGTGGSGLSACHPRRRSARARCSSAGCVMSDGGVGMAAAAGPWMVRRSWMVVLLVRHNGISHVPQGASSGWFYSKGVPYHV